MILADYTALVEVTPEMRKLKKWCPICEGKGWHNPNENKFTAYPICHQCKGGLNPDQTKWWEALAKAQRSVVGNWILRAASASLMGGLFIFSEIPKNLCQAQECFHIHRPSGDLRPWPEVLRELLSLHEFSCSASFALATPESAPVFKSFGIKTLVEV